MQVRVLVKDDIYSFFLDAGPWLKSHLVSQLRLVSQTRYAEKCMDWDYYVEKYRNMFIEEHGFDPIEDDNEQRQIVENDRV